VEQFREHSSEVMLPMLQYFFDYSFQIVPITLSNQSFKNAKSLAFKIKETAQKLNRKILLIASSDFSHFLSPEKGKEMDDIVLRNILLLDSAEIEKVVRNKNISVCGYGPIMTLIEYSKLLSDKPKAEILKRGHSGEIIPSSEVVDYISILLTDFNSKK
jgi:AmmeMemoRadiSam system protein B